MHSPEAIAYLRSVRSLFGKRMGRRISTGRSELEFDHWARTHGYTLAPAFYRRSAGSVVDEHQTGIIRCPLIYLGIYEGQTVPAVCPYSDGDTEYTIHDGVEKL